MNNKEQQIFKEHILVKFNNLLLELITSLADVCPDSIIGKNISAIQSVVRRTKQKDKYVKLFVVKVLKYKKEINNFDEKFFTRGSFNSDADGNMTVIDHIFTIQQNVWCNLSSINKMTVFKYMQYLCKYTQDYLLITR
uniref:Uncharacterized protein n=1 Tax=Mimivirus LCMiAC01 TaxID=2506608 RepID=A0A481YZF8_9VIRU|nr:MAG: hypothetical protein LCMiAC01_00540 [Mimivirus LCMiAC01]